MNTSRIYSTVTAEAIKPLFHELMFEVDVR